MMERNDVIPPARAHSAVGLMQWSSPDCPDATSGQRDIDRLHPACFPMMERNDVIPPARAHSAVGLMQKSARWSSPDCPEATSGQRDVDRLHPACFPMMERNDVVPPARAHSAVGLMQLKKKARWSSPDCPDLWWMRDVDAAQHPGCAAISEQNKINPVSWKDSRIDSEYKGNQPWVFTAQLPTCSETLTVNCQPSCTESNTTGCTEVRSAPQDIPMRDWDYRDRYEGPHTFKGEIQDDGSNAGYKIY